jgi:ATP-dependent DNA helicase RecG
MPGAGQAHDEAHHEAHDKAHEELTDTEARVLAFVEGKPKSRPEIAGHLGVKSRSGHLYKAIDHLRNLGFLEFIIPDKPQSKNQKLRITQAGHGWLARRAEQG